MKKEIEKQNDSDIFEGMPSISAVIKAIKNQTTNRKIIAVYVDKSKKKSKEREISFLQKSAQDLNFTLEFVSDDIINEHTVGTSHGGIIAFCSHRDIPDLNANFIKENGVYFYLDGVEDPYNFGYSVRSLYAFGADGVILPRRNWMGVSGVVARSSAGSSELIDIKISDAEDAIDTFKSLGYTVICAGIRDSQSIFETDLKKPLLVIIGGEKRGISSSILAKADNIVRIDYGRDFKGSLPTASATSIFAYEILRACR